MPPRGLRTAAPGRAWAGPHPHRPGEQGSPQSPSSHRQGGLRSSACAAAPGGGGGGHAWNCAIPRGVRPPGPPPTFPDDRQLWLGWGQKPSQAKPTNPCGPTAQGCRNGGESQRLGSGPSGLPTLAPPLAPSRGTSADKGPQRHSRGTLGLQSMGHLSPTLLGPSAVLKPDLRTPGASIPAVKTRLYSPAYCLRAGTRELPVTGVGADLIGATMSWGHSPAPPSESQRGTGQTLRACSPTGDSPGLRGCVQRQGRRTPRQTWHTAVHPCFQTISLADTPCCPGNWRGCQRRPFKTARVPAEPENLGSRPPGGSGPAGTLGS